MSQQDVEKRRPERLRLTTGMLMVWVAAVAVALAIVKGDVAEWIPTGTIEWLSALAIASTVLVIPWLDHRLARSPESLRPESPRAKRAVNFLALTLILCMAASAVMLAVLFYQIWAV